MKKLLLLLVVLVCFTSCVEPIKQIEYPRYTLIRVSYIPDSLRQQQREWVKESIRASNQHLTAGDYEDIDETIEQVERTSNNLFEVTDFGLNKEIDEERMHDEIIRPNELTSYEKRVLESLIASK